MVFYFRHYFCFLLKQIYHGHMIISFVSGDLRIIYFTLNVNAPTWTIYTSIYTGYFCKPFTMCLCI